MRLAMLFALALPLFGQAAKGPAYTGPRPPKSDLPYLLHATNLVETEQGEAKESKRKDDTVYTLAGATAKARTPVPEPIFLIKTEKLLAEKIACWKLEVKGSQRELVLAAKQRRDSARPVRLSVTKLVDNIYKLEVSEPIENGEYVLTPDGSNEVFAFTVY